MESTNCGRLAVLKVDGKWPSLRLMPAALSAVAPAHTLNGEALYCSWQIRSLFFHFISCRCNALYWQRVGRVMISDFISYHCIAALSAGVPIQILPGEPVEALAREPTSNVDAVVS